MDTNNLMTRMPKSNELVEFLNKLSSDMDALAKKIENLSIPTKLSQLENDMKFITANDESIESKAPLMNPKFIGDVLLNGKAIASKEEVPTKLSDLENDTEFITANDESIISKAPLINPNFSGAITLNHYKVALRSEIPDKLSDLKNDTNFITSADNSIKKKADKAVAGYNSTIENLSSYPFVVSGDSNKAAGITFDRGKFRINFGIDKDNKLKIGGGTSETTKEIIDSENILSTLFENGIYLFTIKNNKFVITDGKNEYELVCNPSSNCIELKKIVQRGDRK